VVVNGLSKLIDKMGGLFNTLFATLSAMVSLGIWDDKSVPGSLGPPLGMFANPSTPAAGAIMEAKRGY
jgi:hypothetical protein